MTFSSNPIWVFGYGSLIWRTEFEFDEAKPAYIKHWQRRFWQGSTDHRGTPEAPGRVVTLIEARDEICWGMAYRLNPNSQTQVMSDLDYRERGGYEQIQTPLYFSDGSHQLGISYHATIDNPNYLGAAPLSLMAEQIFHAVGPSGPNIDYLLNLEHALTQISAPDQHVSDLAAAVRSIN